ncbi:MAG: DUF971 family protein [Flavobacteriales bacterium]|jgi:DUF971 family protein
MRAPSKITIRKDCRSLRLQYGETCFELAAEYLRVFSPSAEVQGHGPGQEVLVTNKTEVKIHDIQAQGNYAIRIGFDDSHDSGIYTWSYLFELGEQYKRNWADYLERCRINSEGLSTLKWQN